MVDLKDALYNAENGARKDKEVAVNPLVQDGQKLVPSVTRVFSTGHEMYVYLQAYKQAPQDSQLASPPLFAFVSLYLDGNKVLETPPSAVVPNSAGNYATQLQR